MTRLVEYVYKRFKKKAERESIDTILNDSAYHVSADASGFTQE